MVFRQRYVQCIWRRVDTILELVGRGCIPVRFCELIPAHDLGLDDTVGDNPLGRLIPARIAVIWY